MIAELTTIVFFLAMSEELSSSGEHIMCADVAFGFVNLMYRGGFPEVIDLGIGFEVIYPIFS